MITLVNKSTMSTYTIITDDVYGFSEAGFSVGQGPDVDESVVFVVCGETLLGVGSSGRVQFVHPPSALHRSQVQ